MTCSALVTSICASGPRFRITTAKINHVYRRTPNSVAQRELSRSNGERFMASGYCCAARGSASQLQRYGGS